MVEVKLYVEGGARNSNLERRQSREAFKKFFEADPRLQGKLPRTVPCGGRKAAFNAFVTEALNRTPGVLPLLLVDSEIGVPHGKTVWQHLKTRPDDNWDKPEGVTDNQAFLMVQVMETWFIADRDALQGFFGDKFRSAAILAWPDLENVPKQSVYDVLDKATADCGARQYAKGRLSFDLLSLISPAKVEAASLHAKALLECLRNR